MKHLTATLSLSILFFSGSLCAQDIITLKNGEEVKSKVVEVNTTEVKYKKHSNLEGPTYSATKSDIFMIKYENGEKEVYGTITAKSEITPNVVGSASASNTSTNMNADKLLRIDRYYYEGRTKISKKEFQNKLETNSKAYNEYLIAKQLGTVGTIANCISILSSIRLITDKEMTVKEKRTTNILSWGSLAVGLGFSFAKSNRIRNAVEIYNTSFKTTARLSISENGVGLALHF